MPALTRPTHPATMTLPPRAALVAAEADVLVVGGGPAGIGAALGAAEAGAEVVLAERYGFILSADGAEIYFHENALVGTDYDELAVGDEVSYAMHDKEGIKGPQASTVKLETSERRRALG